MGLPTTEAQRQAEWRAAATRELALAEAMAAAQAGAARGAPGQNK